MKYREEKAKLSAAKARAAAAMAGGIERKPWSHDACAKEAVPKHGPNTDQ